MFVLGAWSLVLRPVPGPWSTLVLGTWRKRKDRPVEAEMTKETKDDKGPKHRPRTKASGPGTEGYAEMKPQTRTHLINGLHQPDGLRRPELGDTGAILLCSV